LNRDSKAEKNELPDTAARALAAMRTETRTCEGKPAPPGVKVMVSRAGDHVKAPVAAGSVEKAESTLRASIGSLN